MAKSSGGGASKSNRPNNNNNGNGASAAADNGANGTVIDPARQVLAERIAQLRELQEKLEQLNLGFGRAEEHGWQLSTALSVNAEDLKKAEANEISRLANAYISNGGSTGESPVVALQARRTKLQKDDHQNDEVKKAITSEVAATETRIANAHRAVAQALSNVICGADGFRGLYSERLELFARLRGIRKCLAHIRHELSGQMPHDLSEKVDLVETYEFDRQGFAVDDGPVTAWAQALSELLEDPLHAPLPGEDLGNAVQAK